jgi:hypothetical protein
MDEELGSHFVLAVEELGLSGLYTTIREVRGHAGPLSAVSVVRGAAIQGRGRGGR